MNLSKGEFIFRQDESGDQAYLIESGQVEIFHTHKNGQETLLAVLNEGEIFGEMALIDSDVRSATARALTNCQLMIIRKEQLLDKLDSSDPTVQLIMKILLKRLRQQNQINSGAVLKNLNSNNTSSFVLDKLKLENQINEAYQNKELVLFHQPIFDLETGEIAGSEALIRWESPQKGLISPAIFIDILENSSMIIPVGYWIIEECFNQSKKIAEKSPGRKYSISINVSGRQFASWNFIETLKALVAQHKVDPKNFKLEVTERILVDGGAVIDALNKCRELGFEISLDDFGTGFSSLQYLSQMPIDYLKIDRSFVTNILKNEKNLAVVSSIIYLAKKLNLKIIAEGIENQDEERIMKDLGCDYGQGYMYSKPIRFEKLLEKI